VQIGITDRCNYRCLMCPDHSPLVPGLPPEGQRAQMPLAVLQSLLGDLVLLGGTRWIDLVGIGEPLLHLDFMHWAGQIKQAGFGLCISTNGSLLDEEKARNLAEIGLDRINVSINAGSDEVYTQVHPGAPASVRRRILASLKAMNARCDEIGRRRPALALSAVVFRATYRDLLPIIQSAAEVNAEYVHFHQMATAPATEELALGPEEWQQGRDLMREVGRLASELKVGTNASTFLTEERPDLGRGAYRLIRCYAGHVFTRILADGQVRFCCGCDWSAGNLNEQPFRHMWRSRPYRKMRRLALGLPRGRNAPPHCACFTACPHHAHNVAIHNMLFPDRLFPVSIAPDPRLLG
jgi:MoaA/NifB/PqqE/SkfB family radical SAM enzyme